MLSSPIQLLESLKFTKPFKNCINVSYFLILNDLSIKINGLTKIDYFVDSALKILTIHQAQENDHDDDAVINR